MATKTKEPVRIADVTGIIFKHYFQKYLNDFNPYTNIHFEVIEVSENDLEIEKIRVRCKISCATEAFVFDKVRDINLDQLKKDFLKERAKLDMCISTNYSINVSIKANTETTNILSNFGDQTIVFETSKDVILRYFDVDQNPASKLEFLENIVVRNIKRSYGNELIVNLIFGTHGSLFSNERKIHNLQILAMHEPEKLTSTGVSFGHESILNLQEVQMIEGIENPENVYAIVENGYVFKFIETSLSPSGDVFNSNLLKFIEFFHIDERVLNFKNRVVEETLQIKLPRNGTQK